MDRRPIGVFDSGLGGLTAVRELARIMPEEDLVYFGDTGRVPYGSRSRETIIHYARQDVAFLNTFHPKASVIACGPVSTTALEILQQDSAIPIFGVVESAARAAARLTKNGKVGLIGTEASIRSGAYERALAALAPSVEILTQACPLLVPLVENGRYQPGDTVAEKTLPTLIQTYDTTKKTQKTHFCAEPKNRRKRSWERIQEGILRLAVSQQNAFLVGRAIY